MGTTARKLEMLNLTKNALSNVLASHVNNVPQRFADYPQAFEDAINAGGQGGGGELTPAQRNFIEGFTTGNNYYEMTNDLFNVDMYAVSSCQQLTAINVLKPLFSGKYCVSAYGSLYSQYGEIHFHDVKELGDGMTALTANDAGNNVLWSLSADSESDLVVRQYCFQECWSERSQNMIDHPPVLILSAVGNLSLESQCLTGNNSGYYRAGMCEVSAMTLSGNIVMSSYASDSSQAWLYYLHSVSGDIEICSNAVFNNTSALTSFFIGSDYGKVKIGDCALCGTMQLTGNNYYLQISANGPENLEIGNCAFMNTAGLTSISIYGLNEQEIKSLPNYGTWFQDSSEIQRLSAVQIQWFKNGEQGVFTWESPNSVKMRNPRDEYSPYEMTVIPSMAGQLMPDDVGNQQYGPDQYSGIQPPYQEIEVNSGISTIGQNTFKNSWSITSMSCYASCIFEYDSLYGLTSLTGLYLPNNSSADVSCYPDTCGLGHSDMGDFEVSCECLEGTIVVNKREPTVGGAWIDENSSSNMLIWQGEQTNEYGQTLSRSWADSWNMTNLMYVTDVGASSGRYPVSNAGWYLANGEPWPEIWGTVDAKQLYINGTNYNWSIPPATRDGYWNIQAPTNLTSYWYNEDVDPDSGNVKSRKWQTMSESPYYFSLIYVTEYGAQQGAEGCENPGWYYKESETNMYSQIGMLSADYINSLTCYSDVQGSQITCQWQQPW